MYIQVCTITNAQAGEGNGLTDDGMSSHMLTDDSRIAAQKNWQGRDISTGIPLADLVHFTAVDGPILAFVSNRVHLLKLCILPAFESGVAQQLLDCIVQGTIKENHTLSPICWLGKVFLQDTCWNVELYRLLSHSSHFDISDPVGPELRIGRPLKQPVSVCITSVLC
jgi:hypothetical protein